MCARERRRSGTEAKPARAPRAAPRAVKSASAGSRRRRGSEDVVVRRVARSADDGFMSELAPGLRSRADAQLLADELAFAAARLSELEHSPPGLLGEAARLAGAGRREEGLWLLAQITVIGPREEGGDPFAAIAQAAVPWTAEDLPVVAADERGPRGSSDPATTLRAYRAWAARSEGQAAGLAGDAAWSPARRFERAFERLALPGFARAARYDFLLAAGALGVADVRPASLQLMADPRGATVAAAKRVFAFGDPIVLERRAAELAGASALPPGALDLGLSNWALRTDQPDAPRVTLGSQAAPDPVVRDVVLATLGADEPAEDADDGDEPSPD